MSKMDASEIAPAVWALALLLAFMTFRPILILTAAIAPSLKSYLCICALSAAFALAGWRIRMNETGILFARLGTASAIGMAIYFLVEPTIFTAIRPDVEFTAQILWFGDYIAIAAAIAGIWRPAFLMFPGAHIITARMMSEHVSGLPTSYHDILYLAEACMFIAASSLVFKRLQRKRSNAELTLFMNSIAFIAIGFHIANYVWSGIAKLRLQGAPFEWLYANDVSRLLTVAMEKGVAPLAVYPPLAQFVHDSFSSGLLAFNGFVLAMQMLAIVTVARLLWMRISAICFDMLHFGVYFASGILFWPWIWMNGIILWAIRGKSDADVGFAPKFCATITILLSGLPFMGSASWLGWYDIASTRMVTVEAQTAGSKDWTPVPLALFGAHAYPVSHGWFDRSHTQGHYPPDVAGLASTADRQREDRNCPTPAPVANPETPEARDRRLQRFDAFMRARHAQVLQETATFGPYSYYWRLHHHTSISSLHAAFHAIPLDQIARYRLVTRSVCLSLVDGRISRRILKEDAHVFELR